MIAVIALLLLIILVVIIMVSGAGSGDPCSCHRCGKYTTAPSKFCSECKPKPFKPAAGPRITTMKH